jgi:L-alanine-DL-glutamate epimerase-like enolase superfamily enzyme
MMQVRHSFTARQAVNGIWLADKPLHCRLNGSMTARTVVQTLPNSTKCGGLTEAWRIAWMAYEHNIQFVPRGWNTALGLAADLHLTPVPYIDELIAEPFRLDADGYLHVPTGPGRGVEVNREVLRKIKK